MSEISNPHDSFFRETFSRKEVATDFLSMYLPDEITQHINLDTLKMSKDTFVDEELRSHFSDLLYTVKHRKEDLHLYLLFEHKSSPDSWISLQLLRYMVKIWDLYRKQHPKTKKLPTILPLVLYHGYNKWKIPQEFNALLAQNDDYLKEYTPNFQYLLHDFSFMSNEEIRGKAILRLTLQLFKHIKDPALADKLPQIINLLQEVSSKQTALEILEILLRYVVKGTKRFTEQDMTKIFTQTSMEDNIMKTFIDDYIEQGLKQGIQQGIQQGMQQGMQQGIQQGSNKVLIIQLTHRFGSLPKWAEEKIHNADIKTLEKWSLQLLSANELDEVFH